MKPTTKGVSDETQPATCPFLGAAGVGLAALGGGGCATYLYADPKVDTVGRVDFTDPLRIPALQEGQAESSGARVFDLQMKPGSVDFRPGPVTATWGFNGDRLGPTLRARRGDTVRVNIRNSLPETSSVHWHGMHLAAAMDGGPHQSIAAVDSGHHHDRSKASSTLVS